MVVHENTSIEHDTFLIYFYLCLIHLQMSSSQFEYYSDFTINLPHFQLTLNASHLFVNSSLLAILNMA